MNVDRIAATIEAINAEHQAARQAEARQDADAWCGAVEARDCLLDDLSALYRQRRLVSVGVAPLP